MKKCQSAEKIACFVIALLLIANSFGRSVVAGASVREVKPVRVTTNFDGDWRFLKADATGAEKPEFDDSTWRKLDVPHDWSIEGPFDEKNPTGGASAFFPAGIGWYRKKFTLFNSMGGGGVFDRKSVV